MTGVAGLALTKAVVVPLGEVQPATVVVTLYVPEASVVAPGIVGFWSVEVKPFGPDQVKPAPACPVTERESVCPAQIGPELEPTGAEGIGLTITAVALNAEVQPLNVIVKL